MTTPVPSDRSAAPAGAPSDRSVPVPPPADAPAEPDVVTAARGDDDPPPRSAHHRVEAPATWPSRGVYLVPALLVVALVLLVVGLVTGASVWLAASLGASVLAALLLVGERLVQRRRAAVVASTPPASPDAADTDDGVVDLDVPAIDPDDAEAVWVVDGRPRYHARGCETLTSLPAEPISRTQALEDGFVACSLCEPGVSSRAQHGR